LIGSLERRYCNIQLAAAGHRPYIERMVMAAKSASQVALHMVVAFGVMYAVTGSLAFGGLAAVIEPVVNVVLLPLHERAWLHLRRRLAARRKRLSMAT
jgi:uncharacterized membrane protein